MKVITITARRWFQKTYGNTYHSVEVSLLDGDKWKVLGVNNFEYGYGNHYLHSATTILKEHGLIPEDIYQINHNICEKYHLSINEIVSDVSRKKDLAFN